MTVTPYKIALAGCGKMGTAMATAWLDAGMVATLDILDPNGIPDSLLHKGGVSFFKSAADFAARSGDWDILVVAVKPQTFEEFAQTIRPLPPALPLLSIMAGKTIAGLETTLGAGRAIIRSMPNTPASIGKGMTVACTNACALSTEKDMTQNLLSSLGTFSWIDSEDLLDAVTGVSGSGPAYVFYLMEAMTNAGMAAGLPADLATTLARQTVIGAAALAEQDAATPASRLRENVTSPNGTTAAALEVLMEGKFQDILTAAIGAATARSKELSK